MTCSELQVLEATQMVVCVASSFHWTSLVGPGIIAVSAMIAIAGVISARKSIRQRATLDMIEKVESTPHYKHLHSVFSYHRRCNSFSRLHDPHETKDRQERQNVLDYLNHYELVSVGICKSILDEKIYRAWMQGPFVRDWNSAASFIQRERWKWDESSKKWKYHRALYEYYEAIARKWSPDAVALSRGFAPHPDKPSGPGDEALPKAANGDPSLPVCD